MSGGAEGEGEGGGRCNEWRYLFRRVRVRGGGGRIRLYPAAPLINGTFGSKNSLLKSYE